MKPEIWVFAEQQGGRIKGVTYELTSEGRRLAHSLQAELCVVCLGHNVKGIDQLASSGADRVYVVDDLRLGEADEELYTAVLLHLIRQRGPEILLAGATSLGRS
ncbi:MAG: electron transfer flavoprotein subunit alpha, partial [Chloroflexi bacterium]|nr:electron transfer flavoprotein subunit alpha [Chloroflexota bacterium]